MSLAATATSCHNSNSSSGCEKAASAFCDPQVGLLLAAAVYHAGHVRLSYPDERPPEIEGSVSEPDTHLDADHGHHADDEGHDHVHPRLDAHGHGVSGQGHSHGLVDPSIVRSREGVKAVSISLGVLLAAALAQTAIFLVSSSVALLADLIHNFGDALTAIPLGIAFILRSFRGEKLAGLAVVAAILISALVALYETIQRLLHPEQLSHLWVIAAAGLIGFIGNEIAAQIRLRAGRRLASPALVADGNHARVDGFVSLGVIASALLVGLGLPRADPIVGLAITLVILKITWDSWQTIRASEPGEALHDH